jgi:hypothetical protein
MAILKEPDLDIGPFMGTRELGGLEAVAVRIKNLLLMEPGTHPDDADMGVGLGLYRSEILTEELRGNLAFRIQRQILKYLTDAPLTQVTVTQGADPLLSHANLVDSNPVQDAKRINIRIRFSDDETLGGTLVFSASNDKKTNRTTVEVFR